MRQSPLETRAARVSARRDSYATRFSGRVGATTKWMLGPLALAVATLIIGCGGGEQAATTGELPGFDIADVGFMTPESVLMDTIADVYLVSNVNGSPTGMDDNGFISRVSPDGQVMELKWIDGAAQNVTLNGPKGMAIRGDSLFVADIDCVRIFNRVSGDPLERVCVQGATFLNDVAAVDDGSLFVTDSGLRVGADGLEPTGTDAVYRLVLQEGQEGSTLAKSPDLGAPNGIAVSSRGIFVVTFNSGEIISYTAEGERRQVMSPSSRQLDGIVFFPSGEFAFSNWADSSVYHVSSNGTFTPIVRGLDGPADIGFDPRRNRLLIPQFNANVVSVRELPSEESTESMP